MVNFFQDDTRGAARKLLIITALGIFRVAKIPTLKMPKYLLLSGLQVALAVAVLWRWQAGQRHGPRRIAQHPERSGPLPLFGAHALVTRNRKRKKTNFPFLSAFTIFAYYGGEDGEM